MKGVWNISKQGYSHPCSHFHLQEQTTLRAKPVLSQRLCLQSMTSNCSDWEAVMLQIAGALSPCLHKIVVYDTERCNNAVLGNGPHQI